MTTSVNLTSNGTVNTAATLVDRTQRWLRTDQAAIMRQLPEQQSAATWWAEQGHDLADSTVTVPAWIEHYYGQNVTADPHHTTLSATASAVAGLLTSMANRLEEAPLYLVDDPDVRIVLATLARTNTYRQTSNQWPTVDSATVLFSTPIPIRQHTAQDVPFPGLQAKVERTSTPTLAGVTWYREPELVRCLDWIHTEIDTLGIANLDQQISDNINSASRPPMLNNGQWKLPLANTSTQTQARQRLLSAYDEVMNRQIGRWDGDSAIDDIDTLFAARLASVAADAIAGEMFTIEERRIRPHSATSQRKSGARRKKTARSARTSVFTVVPRPRPAAQMPQ